MAENDCIFCKIIHGEIPSELVYEDDWVAAFKDVAPVAPVHILIVPKKHIPALNDASDEDSLALGKIQLAAVKIAEAQGIKDKGYRLISNCGKDAGQVVMHIHYHLIGGKSMGWSPD